MRFTAPWGSSRPSRKPTGRSHPGPRGGLGLLHGVGPRATTMGALIRPTNPNVERQSKDLEAAARNFGLKLEVLTAGVEGHFDGAFTRLAEMRAGGLVIATDGLFISHSERLAALTVRHAIPAIF